MSDDSYYWKIKLYVLHRAKIVLSNSVPVRSLKYISIVALGISNIVREDAVDVSFGVADFADD